METAFKLFWTAMPTRTRLFVPHANHIPTAYSTLPEALTAAGRGLANGLSIGHIDCPDGSRLTGREIVARFMARPTV